MISSAGTRNKHPWFLGQNDPWPTWAPDWNLDTLSKRSLFPQSSGIGINKPFDATFGSAVPQVENPDRYDRESRCLPLKGRKFSLVKTIHAQYMPGPLSGYDVSLKFNLPKTESVQLQTVISSWLQTVLEVPRNKSEIDSEVKHRFARMLVASQYPLCRFAPKNDREYLYALLRLLQFSKEAPKNWFSQVPVTAQLSTCNTLPIFETAVVASDSSSVKTTRGVYVRRKLS
jgi:hypothetical protein